VKRGLFPPNGVASSTHDLVVGWFINLFVYRLEIIKECAALLVALLLVVAQNEQ